MPKAPVIQVYAGTAGHSAWFSDDLGVTWVHPNSHSGLYLEARVWCFASHSNTPTHLFAGTDAGVYRWDEPSARWQGLPSPLADVWAIVQDPLAPDTLIAGGRPAGFYRSEDAGRTWVACPAPGIAAFSEVNMGPTRVTRILFDPVERDVVWAGVEIGAIFRSTDRGRTWQMKGDGLVSGDVHDIAALPLPDGRVRLLATTNRGLHISEDRAEQWRLHEIDSPWQYTRGVTPLVDDPSTVFLCNGNGPPGNDGRLMRSRDYGITWSEITLPGELNSTPWCVATHSSDPSLLFTCTNLGQLFRTTDRGETWVRLPHEFGEIRSLHWRPLPVGMARAPHSVTRPMVKRNRVTA